MLTPMPTCLHRNLHDRGPSGLRSGRMHALVLGLMFTLASSTAPTARAQEASPARSGEQQAARNELWLSVGASLVTAGIAGGFALQVAALHDRAAILPENSPEQPSLEQQATDARRYAVGFGVAASLLTLTSVLLLIYQPGPADASSPATAQLAPTLSTQQMGVVCRGEF